jgi:hypothetical protein
MVNMRKYTSILTLRMQHSSRSVYLEEPNCSPSLRRKYFFIFDKKEYISKVNTKSKNTKQQCVHLGVRDTPLIQIYFSWKNFNFHVDTSKLNHSWFRKNRTKTHSVISNVRTRTNRHQMQMLILNRLRLKTWLFSNTVSSNNGVFKGKVFKQNETLQPIGKVIKKILIRKQNYA